MASMDFCDYTHHLCELNEFFIKKGPQMTKEQFHKLFMAVVRLGYSEGDAVEMFYKQDLISWR